MKTRRMRSVTTIVWPQTNIPSSISTWMSQGARLAYREQLEAALKKLDAQAVVDHDSDMIVAADVVSDEADNAQLVPMVEQVQETLGQTAAQTVADAGYYAGEQIAEA